MPLRIRLLGPPALELGGERIVLNRGASKSKFLSVTIEKRVVIEDLHATLFQAMGISPRTAYEIEKRPFYVTRDGLGRPIRELLG